MDELRSMLQLLRDGGVIACLLLFIAGLMRRWWIMGGEFEVMKDDRDFYRDRAWTGTELGEAAVEEVERRPTHRAGGRRD